MTNILTSFQIILQLWTKLFNVENLEYQNKNTLWYTFQHTAKTN